MALFGRIDEVNLLAKYQKTISDAIMMADALKIGHNTQKLVRIPLRILFS